MLTSLIQFADYFAGVRRRTLVVASALPENAVDWAPRSGEFTAGDILRHLAAAQLMYLGAFFGKGWHYPGHRRHLAPDKAAAVHLLEERQREFDVALRSTSTEALSSQRADLAGRPLSAWRIVMMLVEHEIHHRSQLDTYLSELGILPPHLFGAGVEELPSGEPPARP